MEFIFQENDSIELKEIVNNTFLKAVSAFANFHTGTIYFGVKDNGKVIGIQDSKSEREKIENIINDSIKPVPKYKLTEHVVDGKTIIELDVYKGEDTPYLYKNIAYKRADTSSVPCGNYYMRALLLKGMNMAYEELPYENGKLSFNKLSERLRSIVCIEDINLDVLKSLGLYKDGNYNNAAAFLADENNFFSCGIDMVRFGENINIFLDRVTVEKRSLLEQYDAALNFFDKWYSPYEEISGFFRETRIHIPREAFRESIANALCHRDYDMNSKIRVECYSDKIKIISPGGLVESLDEESFLRGSFSALRNETVAEVFHRLKLIEKFGTGIKRIWKEYEKFEEKPSFNIGKNAVEVCLPCINYKLYGNKSAREIGSYGKIDSGNHNSDSENVEKNSENVENNHEKNSGDSEKYNTDSKNNSKLTVKERNELILDMLVCDNSLTVKKLSEKIGVSESSINRGLKSLRENECLRYEGSAKTGKWIVMKKDTI